MINYEAFPEEEVLIARGKYSTLNHERKEQIKRIHGICSTLSTAAQAALRDLQEQEPGEGEYMATLENCFKNLKDARSRILGLTKNMNEIKSIAWPD